MSKKEVIQQKRIKRNRKAFLLALILCISVGFAAISVRFNITGNTNVKGHIWDVHLENVDVKEGSIDADVPTINEEGDTLEYAVELEFPGQFYEFTVDAVNDGTIDVAIASVTLSGLSPQASAFITYEVTYLDGSVINSNDILRANTKRTYHVLVKYRDDIPGSSLSAIDSELNLSITVNFDQYDSRVNQSNFVKLVKKNILSDKNIDFSTISSNTNGKGLYVLSSTENDVKPIYYYRGDVNNNNAKFAGFCWKIVRTTETGGTKLVYNGLPNETTGECDATGTDTQIGTSKFAETNTSLAHSGYMYGTPYVAQDQTINSSHLYGNSFEYDTENEEYILSDTQEGMDNQHHYTCFSTEDTCSSISYVYYINGSTAYYITLSDGKSVEDAIEEMQSNTNDSVVKTVIDTWFTEHFQPYFTNLSKDVDNYLEDTIWCSDRSLNILGNDATKINNGWNPNGGDASNALLYGAYGRRATGAPTLACSKNDSFTKSDIVNGNGALDNRVGLLTLDEIILAGGTNADNNSYYLYTGQNIWSMTPYGFKSAYAEEYYMYNYSDSKYGYMTHYPVNVLEGVRPSISVNPNVKIASGGDGTSAHPYEFVVE